MSRDQPTRRRPFFFSVCSSSVQHFVFRLRQCDPRQMVSKMFRHNSFFFFFFFLEEFIRPHTSRSFLSRNSSFQTGHLSFLWWFPDPPERTVSVSARRIARLCLGAPHLNAPSACFVQVCPFRWSCHRKIIAARPRRNLPVRINFSPS